MKKKYEISVLSKNSGILPHTIRMWEKRYAVFTPKRKENGQRLYTEDDLKKIIIISKLLGLGHSISQVGQLTLEELQSLQKTQSQRSQDDQQIYFREIVQKIQSHLTSYKLNLLADELHYLRGQMSIQDYLFKIILPMLREMGTRVAKGEFTVTQEHIVSTIVRDQLSQITIPNGDEKRSHLVFATPEGNLHELSLFMACLLAKTHRIKSHYLGAAHPAQCLGEAINALKGPTLVLGAITSDKWDYDKKIAPFLAAIDQILEYEITVIVGGGKKIKLPPFFNIREVKFINDLQEFDLFLREVL